MIETCVVQVYRDRPSSIGMGTRHLMERCSKPAKGNRLAGGVPWPVCGIHLRSQRGMIEVRPSRFSAMGPVVSP